MNHKHVWFALLFLCPALDSFSQATPPKLIPPSPNAAAFEKYGNIPVSTYTGVPNISIPIYQIKVRDISVPISISYHASGIKVGEEASRVGLGWTLNSGGMISRQINNEDDFDQTASAYLSSNSLAQILPFGPARQPYPNNQVGQFLFFNPPDTPAADLGEALLGQSGLPCDYQPDIFNYNFLGYSGRFIITSTGPPNYIRKVYLEKQEKIKFIPNTQGTMWKVITPDGTIYTFGTPEYHHSYGAGAGTQATAWYLRRINSPQGEQVDFKYDSLTTYNVQPAGHFFESVQSHIIDNTLFGCSNTPSNRNNIPPGDYTSVTLRSITWKTGKLKFNMGGRLDVLGDSLVKSIQLFPTGAIVPQEEFVLGYDYFSDPATSVCFPVAAVPEQYLKNRLKLLSLTKRASSTSKNSEVHSFTYYELGLDRLPYKNSFGRDHWGYSNGKSNISLIPTYFSAPLISSSNEIGAVLGEERNPDPSRLKAYSLKDITYPTKGKTTFYYEPNTYQLVPDNYQIDSNALPETVPVEVFFTYNNSVGADKGTTKDVLLDVSDVYRSSQGAVLPADINITFRTSANCSNYNFSSSTSYFEIVPPVGMGTGGYHIGLNNTVVSLTQQDCAIHPWLDHTFYCCSDATYSPFLAKGNASLFPGVYHIRAFVSPEDSPFIQDIMVNFTYHRNKQMAAILGMGPKYDITGGMRIQKIEDLDPETNKINVRKYSYEDSVTHSSWGKRLIQPRYAYWEAAWEKKVDTTNHKKYCFECYHQIFQSDSYLPATGSSGNIVGYSKVIEKFGLNGENGSTVYEYANEPDAFTPVKYPYSEAPYFMKPPVSPTTFNSLNGMLLTQTHYNKLNQPVHKTENTYTHRYDTIIYGIEQRMAMLIAIDTHDGDDANAISTHFILGPGYPWNYMFPYTAMNSSFYYVNKSVETQYSAAGNFAVTTTNSYDRAAHLMMTKSAKDESNGHLTVTKYKYPTDYTAATGGSVLTAMKSRNMVSSPIVTTVYDSIPGSPASVLHRDLTVYNTYGTAIFPKEKAVLLNSTPVASVPDYVPASGYDASYLKLFTLDYTTDGNVKLVQKNKDIPAAYLWGYNNTLPVAEANNATQDQIYHTSFEDVGIPPPVAVGKAKTGKKILSGNVYTFPLPASGFSPVVSNTLMSYNYWDGTSWKFSGELPYAATFTVAGATYLDEVRAYPKGSQMSTYTYDPLIGIVTQTDANNVTSYYEYDDMNRLKLIRDSDGNILKSYQYVYKK
jgi:hypothetical protein